ncbi:MAG: hypothetical protein RI887_962, partial [Actinomycetota bacterium]
NNLKLKYQLGIYVQTAKNESNNYFLGSNTKATELIHHR